MVCTVGPARAPRPARRPGCSEAESCGFMATGELATGWPLELWWPQGEELRESPGATFPSGDGELMGV